MRFLPGLVLLLLSTTLPAQKETGRWFLANTSNRVEPNGVTTGFPVPNNFFGIMPTSVSDAAGNLLFACDGNTVVDRNLQAMPGNPTQGLGGGAARVLAQKIPNSTRYFIFYAASENYSSVNSPWTLKYAVVDMALNSGKGELVSYDNLVSTGVSPAYTLVQDNNTGNAWLVTHRVATDIFVAYPINTTGLSATPVISTTGVNAIKTDYLFRDLKTSHDGKMLAGFNYMDRSDIFANTRQFIEVFNFDFASGTLSSRNWSAGFGYYFGIYHSVEFSPDDRLLYASFATRISGLQPCGFGSSSVYQFNLCYTDPVEFTRYSSVVVSQFAFCYPHISYGRIQLGADKRIHMPFTGIDISTLEFPNRIGTSVTYSKANYRVAQQNYGTLTVPGFHHRDIEKAVKNNIRYNGGCYPEPTRFEITNDTITRIEWDFGDPASGASNSSTLHEPSHLFSAPGKYHVTAKLFNSNNQLFESIDELVEIKNPQKRILDGYPSDTSFCQGGQFDIELSVVNGIFHWFKKTDDGTEYGHEVTDRKSFTSTEKWYVEMRQNDCDGCIMLDSINITVLPRPSVGLGSDRNLCEGDSLQLQVYDAAADYLWSNGSTNTSIWVKTGGIYWVQGEYDNNGCPSRDSVQVTVVPNVKFSLPGDTTLCNSQQLLLDPGISQASYYWHDGSTSPNFTVQAAGQFWVRVTNSFGCTATDSIQVNYINADEVNLGADTVLCRGASLKLQADIPGATYVWSNGSITSETTVNQTGEYWIRVNNGTCVVADTISVRFDEPLVFRFGADTILCPGEKLLLSPAIVGSQYRWQNGSTAASQLVSSPGIYWVDVTRGGCSVSDTIFVNYYTGQPVLLGPDRRACEGDVNTINAGNGFRNYLWNTGAVTSSIVVTAPGQYFIMATDENGCQSRDTVIVLSPYPLPVVALDNSSEICYNMARTLDAGPGFMSYLWSDGNTSQTKTVSQPGIYSVTVTDINGCQGQGAVTITTILPSPAFYLPGDTVICQYESMMLKPLKQFAAYLWNNSSNTESILVSQAGTYTLEVIDAKGCVGKDTITVLQKSCMQGVYIPNAFSPNRDGINDLFMPRVFGPVSQYKFTVLNRWGEIVFQSSEPGKGWDGTQKGIPQDPGIFVWSCTYQIPGQEVQQQKGHVTLVR